ncbi:hypothetical protein F5Y16DRAFT_398156 [Xylariaceae sp. FL0255]|nr:hypothetical protein F5Y16DRAFT_398156 [Xylariaceae sp. FL0255]
MSFLSTSERRLSQQILIPSSSRPQKSSDTHNELVPDQMSHSNSDDQTDSSSSTMDSSTIKSSTFCWVKNPELLLSHTQAVVRAQVERLNDTNVVNEKSCWDARNVDEFTKALCRIVHPNIVYKHRDEIMRADRFDWARYCRNTCTYGDCSPCKMTAYKTCAKNILNSALKKVEKDYVEEKADKSQRRLSWANNLRRRSTGSPTDTRPNWVQRSSLLLNNEAAKHDLAGRKWRKEDLSREERLDILHQRIIRDLNGKIRRAMEEGDDEGFLLTRIFGFRIAADPQVQKDMTNMATQRRVEHSSVFHRMNGFWEVVRSVLDRILDQCETQREQ